MAWQIDPQHTHVGFSVKYLGIFREIATDGTLDPDRPENSAIKLRIKLADMETSNGQPGNDVLDPNKCPTITFVSTSIRRVGDNQYTMTGDLTIKDVTRPVTLDVRRHVEEPNQRRKSHRVVFSAEGQINYKDFGMEPDMVVKNQLVVGHELKFYIETQAMDVRASGRQLSSADVNGPESAAA